MYSWRWYPSPPETLLAEAESGPSYLFECVGTVPSESDDEDNLVRVWVPEQATPYNRNVVDALEEKHGVYAESVSDARKLDGFTPKVLDPQMV